MYQLRYLRLYGGPRREPLSEVRWLRQISSAHWTLPHEDGHGCGSYTIGTVLEAVNLVWSTVPPSTAQEVPSKNDATHVTLQHTSVVCAAQ